MRSRLVCILLVLGMSLIFPCRMLAIQDNPTLTFWVLEMKKKQEKALRAEIDGRHLVLTINEDQVIDAYYKGVIPLNTLCNSALRSYDEQGGWTAQNYEREISRQQEQEQEEERIRGIR